MAYGIIETPQGYFLEGKRRPRQLTNFIIRPRKEFIEPAEDARVTSPIQYIEADLLQQGQLVTTLKLPMRIWSSRALLRRILAGVGNLTYFGYGTDLQRLKVYLLKDALLETMLLPDLSQRRRYRSARSPLYQLDHYYGGPTQPEYARELIRTCQKSVKSEDYWAKQAGLPVARWRLLAGGQIQPTPEDVNALLIVRDGLSWHEDLNARSEESLYLRLGQRRTIWYQPELEELLKG
jgi:hypothetical protein